MQQWVSCPGCGLSLPPGALPAPERLRASPECQRVNAEVTGFATRHLDLMRLQQLAVDTYGAQHAGEPTPVIRTGYSLVGLHLALEGGLSDDEVRATSAWAGRTRAGRSSHRLKTRAA